MKKIRITKYSNVFDRIGSEITLSQALESIQFGNDEQFSHIRKTYLKDPDEYADFKKDLSAFTFAGTFTERRKDGITDYSGIAILDIDKLPTMDKVKEVKDLIAEIPYTAFCFISPSGYGLKVGVFMSCRAQDHTEGYNQVKAFYESELGGVDLDNTHDINRMCFLSYDPDIYINDQYKKFPISVKKRHSASFATALPKNDKRLDYILTHANEVGAYEEGNRNNFVLQTAAIANRHGLDKQVVIDHFVSLNDLDPNEVGTTVDSAYKNTLEFGVLRYEYAFEGNDPIPFPESVYSSLPDLIKSPLMYLSGKERDMALMALMSFSSSVFHMVSGDYRTETLYPNLSCMIIAPPASGKGIVSVGERLIKPTAEFFDNEKPEIELRRFQLSGNSSSAMLYTRLGANNGVGVIFEKEGDAISNNFRSEWGDITVHLRLSHHNEGMTYERKKENEMIVIENPRFSLLVTMTPNQLSDLVKHRGNGLFSRVLFYFDKSLVEFDSLNPADKKKNEIENEIRLAGQSLREWYEKNHTESISFVLASDQWDLINGMWKTRLHYWLKVYGSENTDVILRLMTSSFKLMMILSVWRHIGERQNFKEMSCLNVDIHTSIRFMDVMFYHAMRVAKIYSKRFTPKSLHDEVLMALESDEFSSQKYCDKFVELGGKRRTAQRRLVEEQGASLVKIAHGKYKRLVA